MKKSYLLVLMCLLLALSPLTALAEVWYVNTSNGGGVNMRSGPGTEYDVVATIGYAQPLDVLEMMPGSSWVNVASNDGYYGYVMMRYLSEFPPAPVPPVPAPTSHPNPTTKPTAKPSGGGTALEKELKQMFAHFETASINVVVVPSTPTTYVNLRWAPSKSAPVRSQFWAGTNLRVLSQDGTWSEVYDSMTGMHGFMMTNFLKPVSYGVDGSDS